MGFRRSRISAASIDITAKTNMNRARRGAPTTTMAFGVSGTGRSFSTSAESSRLSKSRSMQRSFPSLHIIRTIFRKPIRPGSKAVTAISIEPFQYTDDALRQFFNYASKQSWFNNTLFVITADHASAEIKYPEYNTTWGYFSIPCSSSSSAVATVAQHRHHSASRYHADRHFHPYTHDRPYVSFGRNVFDSKKPFASNYIDNLYQLFQGNYLLRFDGKKSVELYDFRNDIHLSKNLVQSASRYSPVDGDGVESIHPAIQQPHGGRQPYDGWASVRIVFRATALTCFAALQLSRNNLLEG